jgi:hypothetical protein
MTLVSVGTISSTRDGVVVGATIDIILDAEAILGDQSDDAR